MADESSFLLDNQAVIDHLAQIVKNFTDLSPVMKAIGETLTESTKERFATSTAPDGTPWAPNAMVTVLDHLDRIKGAYRKDGRMSKRGALAFMAKRPLVETGGLEDSVRWQLIEGNQGVEVGTNRFAGEWKGGAAVFHYGRRDGKMPAREILGISASDEVSILEILSRFAEQATAP